MTKLIISGWKVGLNKVSMTKSIQTHSGLGLATSKNITDRVLDGEMVTIDMNDLELADALLRELILHGAIAEVEI